jgi:hypothetical protein
MIAERLDAGESVDDISADYDLAPSEIEQADTSNYRQFANQSGRAEVVHGLMSTIVSVWVVEVDVGCRFRDRGGHFRSPVGVMRTRFAPDARRSG